jgi:hypothetical protein
MLVLVLPSGAQDFLDNSLKGVAGYLEAALIAIAYNV